MEAERGIQQTLVRKLLNDRGQAQNDENLKAAIVRTEKGR